MTASLLEKTEHIAAALSCESEHTQKNEMFD